MPLASGCHSAIAAVVVIVVVNATAVALFYQQQSVRHAMAATQLNRHVKTELPTHTVAKAK